MESDKPHKCDRCNKSYKVKNSLYNHYKNDHGTSFSTKEKEVARSPEQIKEEKLAVNRKLFLDKQITMEQYMANERMIKTGQAEDTKQVVDKNMADIPRFISKDKEYVKSYFLNLVNSNRYDITRVAEDVKEGHCATVFDYIIGLDRFDMSRMVYDGSVPFSDEDLYEIYKSIFTCVANATLLSMTNACDSSRETCNEESKDQLVLSAIDLVNLVCSMNDAVSKPRAKSIISKLKAK